MSKNEVPRIGFAGCGKCSHTPWEYFARTTGLPAAKYGKNPNFAGFGGSPPPPRRIYRVRGSPLKGLYTLVQFGYSKNEDSASGSQARIRGHVRAMQITPTSD